MKKDIILSGVGGQGILAIAAIIGHAALESGLYLKQAEVHGMSQRGGDVQSHLRLSSEKIFSDLIPYKSADLILSVEPMESLRYLPYLSDEGWLITNEKPFVNINNYPEIDSIYSEIRKVKNHILFDADTIAREAGSLRAMNMVMVGASSRYLDLDFEKVEDGVKQFFSKKPAKIIEMNLAALHRGRQVIEELAG